MLEGMLGEEIFRTGVSAYLKRFEFSNAETDDLWAELQRATQNTVNVKKVGKCYSMVFLFPFLILSIIIIKLGNGYVDPSSRFSSGIGSTEWN